MIEAWKQYAVAAIFAYMVYVWLQHYTVSPDGSIYLPLVLSICLFALWCAVVVA